MEDFLEQCSAPNLGYLEDNEDMEDVNEYEEVGKILLPFIVSRHLLMDEETLENHLVAAGKRKSWDEGFVLKRQFSVLIPTFDPCLGRTNHNHTTVRPPFEPR